MNNSSHLVQKEIVLRQAIAQFLLGTIGMLFCGGLVVYGFIFPHNVDGIWVYFGIGCMLLFYLWYIWLFIIWKVILKDNIIYFTNCLGQKKTLPLEYIEKVKFKIPRNPKHESEAILITKSGEEFLTVPGSARGAEAFIWIGYT